MINLAKQTVIGLLKIQIVKIKNIFYIGIQIYYGKKDK